MYSSAIRVLVLSALLALTCREAGAQQRRGPAVEFVVVEAGTNRPITGARVQISGLRAVALTDTVGRAQLRNVPVGRRMMSISRIGYREERVFVELGRGDVEASVELRPEALVLDAVEVRSGGRVTRLRDVGFYQRQRRGLGAFLDRTAFENRGPMQLIDVFRYMRGFQVIYTPQGEPVLKTSRGSCRTSPLIYLDGALLADMDGRGDPSPFVLPEQVEAIEAYSGLGTIPAQYNPTGSACGVVLIWTRTSR